VNEEERHQFNNPDSREKIDGLEFVIKAIRRHRDEQPLRGADLYGRKIAEAHPEPHRRYVVVRDGRVFTAKPCYGMHEPWWVVQTMEGEAPPVAMRADDCWLELDEER
jgi:hypothetical protein